MGARGVSRLFRRLMVSLISLVLAAGLVPTAQAQNQTLVVEVRIHPDPNLPNGRLTPETGVAVLKVEASVTIGPGAFCLVPIRVSFTLKGMPAYFSAVLNPAHSTLQFGNQAPVTFTAEKRTAVSQLVVTTSRDAPAFADALYRVSVKAEAGTVTSGQACNLQTGQADGSVTIKNDYLALIKVASTSEEVSTLLRAQIENLGNGPTGVRAEVVPDNPAAFGSIRPGVLHLESQATDGPNAETVGTFPIELEVLDSARHRIDVTFIGSYDGPAFEGLQVAAESRTFIINPDALPASFEGMPTPGLDLLGSLAALAFVGFVAWRRE